MLIEQGHIVLEKGQFVLSTAVEQAMSKFGSFLGREFKKRLAG